MSLKNLVTEEELVGAVVHLIKQLEEDEFPKDALVRHGNWILKCHAENERRQFIKTKYGIQLLPP